ncbi:YafY family transcriptional regulator [Methylobacterium sp. E-041]|jgi:predicted DNA-binding transcriptional regulator YafY|uniref:helix-turn-helix transcriptional regulator n=1 Tax=unclassified Methylobacterium TaxID=2615210 RepID=UPI001FB928F1|nr:MULTISPECIES: YafY family protein [unclassified Methylobacterium]MCJ2009036.1 YafY family transcriptional regulator [Methylobacterium sp. J-092]MCJ2077395.1 YafY family transcriptional regulator [Methylobacterium sp. E-016]MCJ2105890.1 YafY family transcriptional regulator [Methylobacterium sp. E-041]MCJ2113892.1 YafY family transcriptional regulator [Methylobacterium sp. E-025]
MARADRLLRLLHAMRVLPAPVTAARLAEETGVSLRSIYRDIDSLRTAGAGIEGERGYGYRLVEDVALPPQTFDRIEIEALVLGLGEVRHMGDPALAEAAASVLAKVAATLSDRREQHLLHAVSQVRRFGTRYPATFDMTTIRTGCWREEAVTIRYADKDGATTVRTILPLSIVYLDDKMTVLAWCCLRAAFRMFRADRIAAAEPAGTSFRPRRVALLRSYVAELGRRG